MILPLGEFPSGVFPPRRTNPTKNFPLGDVSLGKFPFRLGRISLEVFSPYVNSLPVSSPLRRIPAGKNPRTRRIPLQP